MDSEEKANIVCTKHEKEKVKMQATIEKLQEAFCDKESKLQDTKSQLVRERRMSEIMERQLKNARNLSEQLGRIINDREQEIRTLKNLLNKRQDTKNLSETAVQAAMLKASRQSDRRRSTSKDDFQASMRRNGFNESRSKLSNGVKSGDLVNWAPSPNPTSLKCHIQKYGNIIMIVRRRIHPVRTPSCYTILLEQKAWWNLWNRKVFQHIRINVPRNFSKKKKGPMMILYAFLTTH
ncbi:hypothetical protein TNCT_620081 [Trichonephila clavata]|uniref:Uncharacterized protein n=1 Tax=Trichonephila clavata TaxID=2740835 RepID=A0A8X6M0E8_TRICU|nr:hypothetical protein TNCT_620081 [Trichonephila clavata]